MENDFLDGAIGLLIDMYAGVWLLGRIFISALLFLLSLREGI